MPKYAVFSRLYFPVFRLNTGLYGVNLHIQSKYGKYGPAEFGHVLRSKNFRELPKER